METFFLLRHESDVPIHPASPDSPRATICEMYGEKGVATNFDPFSLYHGVKLQR